MMDNKPWLSLLACLVAAILAAVGILIEKMDVFRKLSHPLAERHPGISRVFGRVILGFSLVWLAGALLVILLK